MKRERRIHERHYIAMEASLEMPDGRSHTVQLQDVSFSGASLKKIDPSTPLPPLGTVVRITLRYQSEHGAETETVRACVIRLRPDGLAVRFLRDPAAQSGTA